jgi:hypothetical protein
LFSPSSAFQPYAQKRPRTLHSTHVYHAALLVDISCILKVSQRGFWVGKGMSTSLPNQRFFFTSYGGWNGYCNGIYIVVSAMLNFQNPIHMFIWPNKCGPIDFKFAKTKYMVI